MLLARLVISGHSMEPTILVGKSVLISKIPFLIFKPKTQDIIAFNKNKKIFVKRIVKIDRDKYFVKGDNAKDSLELGWIDRKDIVGKVLIKI